MKFRLPPSCTAVNHGGALLTIGLDHSIEAPEDAAQQFLAHGIVPWRDTGVASKAMPDQSEPVRAVDMSRRALIAALKAQGKALPIRKTDAALRRALRKTCAVPKP